MADSDSEPGPLNDLREYANYTFTYNCENEVQSQSIQGTGLRQRRNRAPAGDCQYSYERGFGGYNYGFAVGTNAWAQSTTITSYESGVQTVYTNYAGEPMLTDAEDTGYPASPKPDGLHWFTFNAYDPQGRLVLTASPSTQMTPDSSLPDLLGIQADGTYQLMSTTRA